MRPSSNRDASADFGRWRPGGRRWYRAPQGLQIPEDELFGDVFATAFTPPQEMGRGSPRRHEETEHVGAKAPLPALVVQALKVSDRTLQRGHVDQDVNPAQLGNG